MSHRNVQPHVSIREVSCYRAERRHWMVVLPTPPSKEVGAPHQPPRVDQKQSGRGFCRTVECTFKVSPCVLLELSWVGKILSGQYQVPCHNQESLESLGVIGLCQHVSRNEVACYRTERTLMGCRGCGICSSPSVSSNKKKPRKNESSMSRVPSTSCTSPVTVRQVRCRCRCVRVSDGGCG